MTNNNLDDAQQELCRHVLLAPFYPGRSGIGLELTPSLTELTVGLVALLLEDKVVAGSHEWAARALEAANRDHGISPVIASLLAWQQMMATRLEAIIAEIGLEPAVASGWRTQLREAGEAALLSVGERYDELELARDGAATMVDRLTDLPNQKAMLVELDEACRRASKNQVFAVIWCDPVSFRDINRRYGEAWGNYALQVVGRRLAQVSRDDDIVARGYGASFVICYAGAGPKQKDSLAQQVQAIISEPMVLRDEEVCLDINVGSATFPVDGRDGKTLLSAAEARAIDAKQMIRELPELNYRSLLDINRRDIERPALEVLM